ncbi:MAG: hypothetical protein IPI73_12710 [Betaproteobacteria bacterium]|nr:hypothetical protein [Betaproteobacteria bacterium]
MDPALANDITVASGAMPPLAGIARNGTYARGNAAAKVAPSAYADPFPPWRVKEPNLSIARRSVPLNLTFADANAADRCGELATSDLEKLRDAVSDGRAAGLPSDQLAARCGRCVQLLAPHLRFGVSGTHDPRREAYCALAVPGSTEFVYNGETMPFTGQEPDDFASLQATARDVCRCADAIKVAGGTLRNAASGVVGTAFIVKLRQPDGTPLTAAASVSIQGPAGWNNGQLAVLSYPAGFLRQFYGLVAAPVAGAYTASVTVGGALYTATFNVAIGTVLASPGAVFPDLTMPGMVGSSWSAVPGAASYLTRVFDVTNNLILAPVAFTTATNAALNGVSLANASTKALQVWAFSNDMTVADPPMPAAFNLAFDRTFISASVTVSPATISVSPSQVVNLTASVSGLANTAVTWTGATATSPNTAQFTAPSNSGTFSATATSVANSAFKGTSRITVSGGTTQCLPWLNMGGFWQVAGFGFHQNCSTHAPFAAFLNGGTISLPTSAAAGEVALSNGLQSYQGTYSCGAGSLFFTSNVSGNATIGMDDSDPSMINVHLILRDPAIPGLEQESPKA